MKKKNSYGLWVSWLLLLGIDLSFRGWEWLAHNLTGLRFEANYLMAAFALLGLLYLLSFIRRKGIFWSVYFLLIAMPVLLQGNYFIVYKRFISPSEFAIFTGSPRMVLAVGAANLNWIFMLAGSFFLFLAGVTLKNFYPSKNGSCCRRASSFWDFRFF